MAFKKTLIKAVPTIDKNTQNVMSWEIVTEYETESGDYSNQYTHTIDVEAEKKISKYTKSELISFMPPMIENQLFPAHYDTFLNPPQKTEEKVAGFDVSNLSD